MAFGNAQRAATLGGTEAQAGRVNYLSGNDPTQWHTNLPTYARVRYTSIYKGIDVVFYGNHQKLEYDFVIAPGADPSQITLDFFRSGARIHMSVDRDGDLSTGSDVIASFRKPKVYQKLSNGRRTIEASYRIRKDGTVGFKLASYDPSRPLIIDPVIVFLTYFAGAFTDSSDLVAVKTDPSGHIYVLARESRNFITKNAFGWKLKGGYDVYLAKFDASGTYLYYATYLGGSQYERPVGLAVDWRGRAAVVGTTDSGTFP